MLFRCLLLTLLTATPALAGFNGTTSLPINGWQTTAGGYVGGGLTDAQFRTQAAAMVSSGLAPTYNYVNIDAGAIWYRSVDGVLHPISASFPDMLALTNYFHSLGLKAGCYGDAGSYQCGSGPGIGNANPGNYGYEFQDAKQVAQQGFDYWKVDFCNVTVTAVWAQGEYTLISQAIVATGSPIYYQVCFSNNISNAWLWAPNNSNLWRISADLSDSYASFADSIKMCGSTLYQYAGLGKGWNFPQELITSGGMTTVQIQGVVDGLAALPTSIILGGTTLQPSTISAPLVSILTNWEMIGVQQDPLGIPIQQVADYGSSRRAYAAPLVNNRWKVLLENSNVSGATMTFSYSSMTMSGSADVRFTDTHADLGLNTNSFSAWVSPTSMALYVLNFAPSNTPTPSLTISPTFTISPTSTPTPTQVMIPPLKPLTAYWRNEGNGSENTELNNFNPSDFYSVIQNGGLTLSHVTVPVWEGIYGSQGWSGCCAYIGAQSFPSPIFIYPTMTIELYFYQTAVDSTTRVFYSGLGGDGSHWEFGTKATGKPFFVYGAGLEVDGTNGTISAGAWYVADIIMGSAGNYMVVNPAGGPYSQVPVPGSAAAFPANNIPGGFFQAGREAWSGAFVCADCTMDNFRIFSGAPSSFPIFTPTVTPTATRTATPSPTPTPTVACVVVGELTPGPTPVGLWDACLLKPVTIAAPSRLYSISVYIPSPGTGQLIAALYDNNHYQPVVIATGPAITGSQGWNFVPLSMSRIIPAGNYLIAVEASDTLTIGSKKPGTDLFFGTTWGRFKSPVAPYQLYRDYTVNANFCTY